MRVKVPRTSFNCKQYASNLICQTLTYRAFYMTSTCELSVGLCQQLCKQTLRGMQVRLGQRVLNVFKPFNLFFPAYQAIAVTTIAHAVVDAYHDSTLYLALTATATTAFATFFFGHYSKTSACDVGCAVVWCDVRQRNGRET